MEMVQHMIAYSTSLEFLWGDSLRTIAYVLNQVPNKSIPKTHSEMMYDKKPSLKRFHVWGYRVEIKPYNLHTKRHGVRTISGYFIGYCVGSKGSKFYC